MRIWSVLGFVAVVSGCDGQVDLASEAPGTPVRLQRWSPEPAPAPVDAAVTFASAEAVAAADHFATAGDHIITVADGVVRVDDVEVARVGGLVSALAASLDGKGQPEIVVAAGGETTHFARQNSGWIATRVAPFGAAHVVLNARSPRGSEVLFGDATRTLRHAVLVDGAFRELALPAAVKPGRALAVAVDASGRSHFAIGADYYGDRGATFAFWPSGVDADGAVAIALDPADTTRTAIHIVHATRRDGGTSLYRTVVGPDSAVTTPWSSARVIVGRSEHLAPADGQLAVRFDDDGHLHTAAALRVDRAQGASFALVYDHDREGAVRHVELGDVRPTGAVALIGEVGVLAADHGKLVGTSRTSVFPKGEPAEVIEPPSVGAVDVCPGNVESAATVLRAMDGLAAVTLAERATGVVDDAIGALEWDIGRGAVRHTRGDEAGWTTTEVTPWQLDTMRAGRSRALIGADGATHLAWPEGDGLAVWSDLGAGWVQRAVAFPAIDDRPSLAEVDGALWVAGRTGGTVSVARVGGAIEVVSERATAQALVAGAAIPTLLFAEPRADGGSEIWVARRTATGEWVTRAVGAAHEVLGLVGVANGDTIIVGVGERTTEGYRVRALEAAAVTRIRGSWPSVGEPGERAWSITRVGDDAELVWSDGRALNAVRLGAAISVDTLEVGGDATLVTGTVTRAGRLVAVERSGDAVRIIAQACAR